MTDDTDRSPEDAAKRARARPVAPTEFRKDGWPLCPSCGEDELWSPLLWKSGARLNLDEKPLIEAFIAAGLSCYGCGWSSERAASAPPASAAGLVTGGAGSGILDTEGGSE